MRRFARAWAFKETYRGEVMWRHAGVEVLGFKMRASVQHLGPYVSRLAIHFAHPPHWPRKWALFWQLRPWRGNLIFSLPDRRVAA